MNELILNIEKWFNSNEDKEISFKVNKVDFDNYAIDREIFLYDEHIVREKLINDCLSSYFKRVEQYINVYIENFSFNNYSNYIETTKSIDNDTIIYFLQWFRDENINNIKRINQESKEYNLRHFYSVIKYYDFLIKNSLENNNYESTLDFLVEFIDNIMDKTLALSNKEIYDQVVYTEDMRFRIPEANLSINKQYLSVNSDKHLLSNFEYNPESANQQAFLLGIINLINFGRKLKWRRFQTNNIIIYN